MDLFTGLIVAKTATSLGALLVLIILAALAGHAWDQLKKDTNQKTNRWFVASMFWSGIMMMALGGLYWFSVVYAPL